MMLPVANELYKVRQVRAGQDPKVYIVHGRVVHSRGGTGRGGGERTALHPRMRLTRGATGCRSLITSYSGIRGFYSQVLPPLSSLTISLHLVNARRPPSLHSASLFPFSFLLIRFSILPPGRIDALFFFFSSVRRRFRQKSL